MTDGATAFVPGHVTGFFTVYRHSDPARAGSRGAGIALSDGVTVEVSTAETGRVVANGDPVQVDAVDRVLDELDVAARVVAETPLPMGAGFGVSGGLALGTALAASAVFDRPRTENDLVTVAHCADVEAGTGLGDVVAQARGGLPVRLDPGAPAHGTLDAIPATGRVEYVSFGDRSTGAVLSGDTDAISAAGDRALARLLDDPTVETFVAASREFAADAGLTTDRIDSVVADVRAAGGTASMAMLGETVFALGEGLSAAGFDPGVCEIHPAGASLWSPRTDGFSPPCNRDGL